MANVHFGFFIIFIIVVIILIVMLYCNVIIYMKTLLNSDCLSREWKMCNTSAKSVIQCKVHIEILDYDWLMNSRVWSRLMKSFVFKLSACPGWHNNYFMVQFFPVRLRDMCAFLLLTHLAFFHV